MNNEKIVKKEEKFLTKNYILITLVHTLLSMPIYMVGNTLSSYLTTAGMAVSLAGTIVSIYFFVAMVMRPFTGPEANRRNKKKFLVFATVMFMLGSALAAAFTGVWAMVVSRVLYGIGWSISSTTTMAYVAETAPRSRLGEAIGFFGMTQIVASAFAPSIALAIYQGTSYRFMLIVTVGIQLMAFVCLLLMNVPDKETVASGRQIQFSFSDLIAKESLLPATIALLFVLVNNVLNTFLVNYGTEQGVEGVSVYFVITSIAMFVVRIFSSKLVDRLKFALAVLPCGVLIILALLSLFVLRSQSGVILAAIFFGSAYGALLPFTQTACVKNCAPEKTGTGSGTYMLGTDVGSVLGSLIGGAVAGVLGYANMYAVFIIPALCGIIIAFLYKEPKKGTGVNV